MNFDKSREKHISKQLSYVLRHKPESIDITLDGAGWTDVSVLISKLDITREELRYVVSNNAKQRFALDDNCQRIRANQGHSIDVNLGLKISIPPSRLYHGTGAQYVESILEQGILKKNRNHVHLSSDMDTAKRVGMRHGKPFILLIDVKAMIEDNCKFYQADNGVWLTEMVEPKYILRKEVN